MTPRTREVTASLSQMTTPAHDKRRRSSHTGIGRLDQRACERSVSRISLSSSAIACGRYFPQCNVTGDHTRHGFYFLGQTRSSRLRVGQSSESIISEGQSQSFLLPSSSSHVQLKISFWKSILKFNMIHLHFFVLFLLLHNHMVLYCRLLHHVQYDSSAPIWQSCGDIEITA